jgi:hypothetical protein
MPIACTSTNGEQHDEREVESDTGLYRVEVGFSCCQSQKRGPAQWWQIDQTSQGTSDITGVEKVGSINRGGSVYAMLTCTHLNCPATAACAAPDLKLDAARSLRSRF